MKDPFLVSNFPFGILSEEQMAAENLMNSEFSNYEIMHIMQFADKDHDG